MLRSLYRLGLVLDQNPNILCMNRNILRGAPTPDDEDDQTVSIVGSEGSVGLKDGFELEAPATASQVYHAAILNGNTLDDLLAVFKVSEGPASVIETPRDNDHARPVQHCLRYRKSSIQTTPDSIMTPRKASKLPVQIDVPVVDERSYGQLVKAAPAESHPHDEDLTASSAQLPSPNTSTCCQPGDTNQIAVCENTSPDHAQCPTFVRRQAKSRLPQRAKLDAKQQQTKTDSRIESAKGDVNADSPSKRNKLQRRPRVV